MDSYEQLEQEFSSFYKQLAGTGDAQRAFHSLIWPYLGHERHYHTIDHLAQGIEEWEEVAHLLEHPARVGMAWLGHDSIFKANERGNEERSAHFMYNLLSVARIPKYIREGIASLILSTRHSAVPSGNDGKYIADIDLTIFGQPTDAFDEYERRIRKEYAFVEEKEFRARRAEILERFLKRPEGIYLTDHFSKKYDIHAQENLRRCVARLRDDAAFNAFFPLVTKATGHPYSEIRSRAENI